MVKGYCTYCPTCRELYSWQGAAVPVPPCPRCAKQDKAIMGSAVSEALEMAEEIESLAGDLPAEGEDFGMSVTEKAADIAANIEAHQRVTTAQLAALENMLDGLRRWFHD